MTGPVSHGVKVQPEPYFLDPTLYSNPSHLRPEPRERFTAVLRPGRAQTVWAVKFEFRSSGVL